jgi:protein TonB
MKYLFLVFTVYFSLGLVQAQTNKKDTLANNQAQTFNAAKDSTDKEIIYEVFEHAPEFPEGASALNYYIEKNLIYPPMAKANNVQGKVLVNLVVDKKGVIKYIKIEKGLGSGCDEEALRLVKKMPKWRPGRRQGEIVNTRIILPIVFKIKE